MLFITTGLLSFELYEMASDFHQHSKMENFSGSLIPNLAQNKFCLLFPILFIL